MCGQDRFSSRPSAPASWHEVASVRQRSSSLSFPEPAMIDAISTRSGNAFLMRSMRGQPPVERLVRDELPVPGGVQHAAAPFVHRQHAGLGVIAEEFRLRSGDVGDRVHADRLRDDAAPAGLERVQDVGLRLGRRRRGEQERILEANPRERHREIGAMMPIAFDGSSTLLLARASRQTRPTVIPAPRTRRAGDRDRTARPSAPPRSGRGSGRRRRRHPCRAAPRR